MTATMDTAGADAGYPMRRWVFDDSLGRFDIDLGDSHVQCGALDDLRVPVDLELNYGVDQGHIVLRELIAARYRGRGDSVLVTHGAQEALYLAYSVLLRPGDQVITFRPGWQQSWEVPPLLGATVDVLGLDADFAIDVAAVAETATDRLRIIVVNSPCNPTGRVVAADDLAALLEIAERAGAYLLLDEEYATDLSSSLATRHGNVVSVSSLSKIYGLPGLRLGWLYTEPELTAACTRRKHLTTIANSVLTETLAVNVLARAGDYLARYQELVGPGLAMLREWVSGHAGQLTLVEPQGTPFTWLWLHRAESSLEFCRRVLDERVLVMPGETLGAGGGIRLSFAREPQVLAEGLAAISKVLRS